MSDIFPPVESATEDGIVAVGGELTPEMLIEAYSNGIFPWPISPQWPLAWFSPDPRGIFEINQLHIPKSLQKFLKKNPFTVRFNTNFKKVIHECANCDNRPGQTDTWITADLARAYTELHQLGLAYSVEVYNQDKLVGGLYGVNLGKIVSAESMFYKESNASKLALITLVKHLEKQEIEWLDIQMITPITELLGGIEIPRQEFMNRLETIEDSLNSFRLKL